MDILEKLNELSKNVNSPRDLKSVLSLLLEKIESIKSDLDLDKIFKKIGTDLLGLNISTIITIIDEKKENLIIRHASINNELARVLNIQDVKKINLEKLPKYSEAKNEKKSIYCKDRISALGKIFEEIEKPNDELKKIKSIISPLILKGELIGFLEIYSKNLEKTDLEIMDHFTRKLLISITNIILYNEIKETEKKYKRIFEDSSEGFVIINGRKKKFTEVNKAMTTITGYTRDELLQMNFLMIFDPDEWHRIEEYKKARLNGIFGEKNSPMNYEAKLLTRDKKNKFARFSITNIINQDEWFATVEDVTEKVKLTNLIEKSKNQYEQAIDAIQDSICVVNTNYEIVGCNKAFAQKVNLPIKNIKGLICKNVIPRYGKELLSCHCQKEENSQNCHIRNVFKDKNSLDFEEKNIDQNGQPFYHRFSIFPIKNKDGDVYQVVINIRDITQKKMAEKKVIELSEFNKMILENAPVSILTTDKNGIITSTNNFFKKMTEKDYLGESIFNIQFIKNKNLVEKYQKLLHHGISFNKEECEYYTNEKKEIAKYLNITAVPLLSKKGEIRGILSMAVDSTEAVLGKKKIEELNKNLEKIVEQRTKQLDEANKELSKMIELKSKFISDASHELRTPLTIIQGNIDLEIHELKTKNKKIPEFYQLISKELDRMSGILSELTDLTNADAKTEKLEKEIVSLNIILNSVMKSLTILAVQKKLELTIEKNLPNINISGDEKKLEKLLMNIIRNAIKYTDVGGKIYVAMKQTGNLAQISVEDDGIGIPENDLPYIFERFYRVDKARSRAEGGTGLGLAICKWIAEAHGGNIEVSSRENMGTKFTINLPINF